MELKPSRLLPRKRLRHLLIVPYGIETQNAEDVSNVARLLIVPYGIETPYIYIWVNRTQPFNRTLWN